MMIIPLAAEKAQEVSTVLGSQRFDIRLIQRVSGLYADISVNGVQIVAGSICRDRCKIIRHAYLGADGDFSFVDMLGTQDPEYSEIGESGRYKLVYLP